MVVPPLRPYVVLNSLNAEGEYGSFSEGKVEDLIDVLQIDEKKKVDTFALASPGDFVTTPTAQADPSVIVTDPTISLYCLDHAARCVMFVQVPHQVDVAAAPFMFMAQYDHAQRVLIVPYDVLHRLAADLQLRAPLVFIHSTGRAGSTLMSKVFEEMEAVTSLSEPDVYTQAVGMRLGGIADDEIRDLLTSATKILFNPAATHGSTLNVVKFRSYCIHLADLLADAFPDAGSLFLYRNLHAYIQSWARAFGIQDPPPEQARAIAGSLATIIPLLAEELKQRTDLEGVEVSAIRWLSAVHGYSDARALDVPMLAVRYEDLLADPSRMLATILAYLGLLTSHVDRGLRAFDRDSQAGSPVSREESANRRVDIDDRQWDLVRDLVRRYPFPHGDIPGSSVAIP